MVGKTISHYRILEKVGEGGMGVVYRAADTKLTRTVALKFLPHGLDARESDRARFLQEARAAAMLNHPNICTIYDVQDYEGRQFILMEYVEGKTLREIVPVKKMQDAIGYAIQIAEALEEAHTHGIVHRDIKAENIMVNSKNQVKVMDFGLAKLKGSLKLTRTGGTVGTLTYMAPEQIRGEQVDARSDIFSFGIVLYEMLTGHLPFRGDIEAAMAYSIMNEEPVPLQQYVPAVPSEMLHLLNRALEKNQEDRYQTITDMLIDLRRIKKQSDRELRHPHDAAPAPTAVLPGHVAQRKQVRKRRLWKGAAGVMVLCVICLFLWLARTHSVRLNPNRTSVTLKIPFTEVSYPSLSRDGNWAAFAAKDQNGKFDIYWMNLALNQQSRATEEGYSFVEAVDLSPDASQIVYECRNESNAMYMVKLVAAQGGGSRTLADTGYVPKWRPDGQRIGYLRAPWVPWSGYPSVSGKFEIWSVKPDGTDNRIEFIDSLHTFSGRVSFCWSPDGKSIAWVRNFSSTHGEVMVRELATGRERQLTQDGKQVDEVIWASNDEVLFVSDRSGTPNLWMIPAGGGEAIPVTQGSDPILGARISADNKTLVYLQRETVDHIWISSLDGSNASQVTFGDSHVRSASFSPDGNHISYVRTEVGFWFSPEAHLVIIDRNGRRQEQLTSGSEAVLACRWSPDGKWIAYSSRGLGEPPDSTGIRLIQPLNAGLPRSLCKSTSLFTWVDSEGIVAYDGLKTMLYSINGVRGTPLYQDSTFAVPIRGKNQLLVNDFRHGKEGWWMVSLDAMGRPDGEGKKILPAGVPMAAPPDWRFLISGTQGDAIWRLWTSTRKEERIGKPLPGANMQDVSMDGKEILWTKEDSRSKLVLVKAVFE